MTKIISTLGVLSILFGSILSTTTINTNASTGESSIISSQSSSSVLSSSNNSSTSKNLSSESFNSSSVTKNSKLPKSKAKLINGEIDTEPDVKMTKKEKERFEKCKKETSSKRRKRLKNKPTPCIKIPTQVNDHITDEDYNILWEGVNQQVEITKGTNMDVEIPLSDYLTNFDIENEKESSSSSSSSSSILSSSSQANYSSESQSSVYSTSVSSVSNLYSPEQASSQSNFSVQNESSQTNDSSNESSPSSETGFLDILLNLGTISTQAATNDGWRLPYQAGQKPVMTSRPFQSDRPTHANFSAYDFAGTIDKQIIAAKGGKVVFRGYTSGFGNHVVVQSQDGSTALYAHLSSFNVLINQDLKRSDKIGVEGGTGNVSGNHLHFETFNRFPCPTSNTIENCFVASSPGVYKGNQYYTDSAMIPQFDECYIDRGGKPSTVVDCVNGSPSVLNNWYESINSPNPNSNPNTGSNQGYIKMQDNSSIVLTVEGNWYQNGQLVPAQTKVGSQTGAWNDGNYNMFQRLRYDSNSKRIIGVNGMCLDAGAITDPNNRYIRLSDCHNGTNQQWTYDDQQRLRVVADNSLCLDSREGAQANSYLYMFPCHGNNNQKWITADLGIPVTGANIWNNYSGLIRPSDNSNMALDVPYAIPTDQTKIQLWHSMNNVQQKWGFDFNTKQLKGLNDKCLDAGDINAANNRQLRINTCHGGTNQKWFADQFARIHSQSNETLCVDSQSGSSAGSTIYMSPCHDGINQRWGNTNFSMESRTWNYPNSCNGCTPMTTIRSAYNSSYVFDMWGGGAGYNQQPIKMGISYGGNNQKFQWNPSTFEIKNIDGKCVDAGAPWLGWSATNTALRVNDCYGGSNQKWEADGIGRIHSKWDYNLCIDSFSGDSYGSILYASPCHNGNNQKWNWW